jgi:hypothetical protein
MKNMGMVKKSFGAVIAMAIFVLVIATLSACGSSSGSKTENKTESSSVNNFVITKTMKDKGNYKKLFAADFMNNLNDYKGKLVYFEAEAYQVVENDDGSATVMAEYNYTTNGEYRSISPFMFEIPKQVYEKNPVVSDQRYQFYSEFRGMKSYETTDGSKNTARQFYTTMYE